MLSLWGESGMDMAKTFGSPWSKYTKDKSQKKGVLDVKLIYLIDANFDFLDEGEEEDVYCYGTQPRFQYIRSSIGGGHG